ncbi:transcriptional regulatory protein LEU3 [Microdochium nivale]|nr:transcriptional regulatory protein LEU3 [Microdochium nivale]
MNWSQMNQKIPPPQQQMDHIYPQQSTFGVSDEARLLNEYWAATRQAQYLRSQLPGNDTNFSQSYPSTGVLVPRQYPASRYDMVPGSGRGYGYHYSNALPSYMPMGVSNLTQPANMIHAQMANMANMAQIQMPEAHRLGMVQAQSTDMVQQTPQYQSSASTTSQQPANATIAAQEEASSSIENKDSGDNQEATAGGETATQAKKIRAPRKSKGTATGMGKNNKRAADDDAETSTPSTKRRKVTKAAPKRAVLEPEEHELEGAADDEDEAEQVESIPYSKKAKGKRPVEKEGNDQAGPSVSLDETSESLDMLERQCCYHCKVKKTRCSLRQAKRGRDEDITNPGLTCERCQAKDLVCTTIDPGLKRGPREGWACAPRLLEMLRRDDERLLYRWCSTMLLKDHLVPRVEKPVDTETTSMRKTGTPSQNNFAYLVSSDGGALSKAFSETAIFQALRPKEKDRLPLPDTEVINGSTVMTKTPERSDSNYRLAIDLIDRRGGAATEATQKAIRAEEAKLEWEIARDLAKASKARRDQREQQTSAATSNPQAEQAATWVSTTVPSPLPLPMPMPASTFASPTIQQLGAGVSQVANHDQETASTKEYTWAADPASVSEQPETQDSLTSGDFDTAAAASSRRPISTSVLNDRFIDPGVLSIDPNHPSIDFLNYQYNPGTTFTFNEGQIPMLGTSEDASTFDVEELFQDLTQDWSFAT